MRTDEVGRDVDRGARQIVSTQHCGQSQEREETIMRMSRMFLIGAGFAVACAGALMRDRIEAAPLGAWHGVRAAANSLGVVQTAACWRFGWHGWGWYRYCGPPPAAPPPAWAWAPGCRDVTVRENRGFETVVRHERRCD
jgi:hypothetical protein